MISFASPEITDIKIDNFFQFFPQWIVQHILHNSLRRRRRWEEEEEKEEEEEEEVEEDKEE